MGSLPEYCGIPAKYIDRQLFKNENFSYTQSILIRLVSSIVFPICVGIDLAIHVNQALTYWVWSKLTLDETCSLKYANKAGAHFYTVQRCAMGYITAAAGLICPDIVTQHFVPPDPKKLGHVEPYGKLYSTEAVIKTPLIVEEVQKFVWQAKEAGKKIAILGAGMSQGKQALPTRPEDLLFDLKHFKKIEIDSQTKVAKVEAGVRWKDLQNRANELGLAVQVAQASPLFSIGGSLSANCHGWDHHAGALGDTVLSITIVDSNGNIRKLFPKDDLFRCVIGGYGGFGIIIEAEIQLTDNQYLRVAGKEILPKDYYNYFRNVIQKDDKIAMHLYRLSLDPKALFQTGVAVNYFKEENAPSPRPLIDEPERGHRLDRVELHAVRRFAWIRNLAWEMEKTDALREKKAFRNELMRPPINPVINYSRADTEWLQEYFVKGEDLTEFLEFLSKTLMENGVPLLNASVRFVKKDERALLGYAKEGDRFGVVLFFNQSLKKQEIEKTKAWVQKVIDYLIPRQGTYFLPYQHFATKEQFQACYPSSEELMRKKKLFDPNDIFQNGLYKDYLS